MIMKFLLVILGITVLKISAQMESCNAKYRTDLRFTCCKEKWLRPGLDLLNLKPKCIEAAENDKCTLVGITWSIYNCTVNEELKGNLSLANFADIMVKHYQTNIKKSITDAVRESKFDSTIGDLLDNTDSFGDCQDVPDDDNNYDATVDVLWKHRALIAIRDKYYEIEKRVCEEISPSLNATKKNAYDLKCYSWMELTYKLGDCCNGIPLPMPLISTPFIPLVEVNNFTLTHLMNLVGNYVGKNLTHSYNLKLCYSTSLLLMLNSTSMSLASLKKDVVNDTKLPDFEKIAENLIPKYYNSELKYEMMKFLTSDLIGNVNHTDFVYFNRTLSHWLLTEDYESFLNTSTTRFLFMHCAAHSLLFRRMKMFHIEPWCGNPLEEELLIDDYDY